MRIATSDQMRQIDKIAIEQYGIPGVVLMENAGKRVAEEVMGILKEKAAGVVLFSGKGNNGGDVMVAARHLYNRGMEVKVFLLAEEDDIKGDARINLLIAKEMNIPIYKLVDKEDLEEVQKALECAGAAVDGILGTGLKGNVRGIALEVISIINNSNCSVVAVDIPSGIHGDTGRICGECVKADLTVTFAYPKAGLLQYPGAEYTGELIVADISIPHRIADSVDLDMCLITGEWVEDIIPYRRPDTHKGTYGRALIIGGSEGMTGAVVLASTGCLRSGSGLIKAAVPAALNPILENKLTEVMTVPLGEKDSIKLEVQSLDDLEHLLKEADGIALGPGMGVDNERVHIVDAVIAASRVPLVLDADALNCLSFSLESFEKAAVPVIITPHPGEMARLMKCSVADVQENRIKAARNFSKRWGVITVLKGANSVIADPDGNIYINTNGNSGMASGGMGDVLTGIITSFICQGLKPVQAACAGVYIHGLAGDLLVGEKGEYGLTATELAEYISKAIKITKDGRD